MDPVDLARWQFGITTVYHFLFVPVTIGLSLVVAICHTMWVRTKKPEWFRLTKFFGKLFSINFALGLVTGLVQEFQFGMNWSDYSRFVGDVFGAPLALEGLLAFFVESTFLGLWFFGWGRIPEKLHAATMWIVHIGTLLSSYFILAANSFMQNPVGFRYNPESHRAEMTDFVAIMTNKVQLVAFPHVIASAYMVGGAVVMGVCLWLWRRELAAGNITDVPMYRRATRAGAIATLVASVGVLASGDLQGKIMTEVQPMKMAAAEALYESEEGAAFSIFTIGSLDGTEEVFAVKVPYVLAFMATGDPFGTVEGINEIKSRNAELIAGIERTYGSDVAAIAVDPDGDYAPNIPIAYWTFRLMMGAGFAAMVIAAALLWFTRGGRSPKSRLWTLVAAVTPLLPLAGNSFGWIFTENGRQPWIVNGLMTTEFAVSPSVSAAEVIVSMTIFTLLYAVLAVIEVKLFLRYAAGGAEPFIEAPAEVEDDGPLQFAY